MNRRFLFLGLAALAVVAILAFGFWGGSDWRDHEQVTRIVPGQNGETLIIEEGGRRGFFPFFPLFFFIPILWFLVIGGVFSIFGWRRWGGRPPFGPRPANRDAWLAEWHQRQHSTQPGPQSPNPSSPESPDTPSQ